jgi:hypothetical protein
VKPDNLLLCVCGKEANLWETGVIIVAQVLCLEPDCNQTVELPPSEPIAVTEEYLPDQEIELTCPNGHHNVYSVRP